ncbi:MAG: GIY-YIG nuclease family protein [Patescibacteria group bacterium]|nr:GIY-YIG nuclease family protein [Patescibacteria group bacterium]
MHYVYMIKNNFNDLYIGITEDLEKRLLYHNEHRGAKFTKRTTQFHIVFSEQYPTILEAHQREIQLKKWRRSKKEFLIEKYQKGFETKLNSLKKPVTNHLVTGL